MSSDTSTTDVPPETGDSDTAPEGEGQRTGFRVAGSAGASPSPSAGRYQRGKELARGGFGRVTSALDRTLQREVAIKELHKRTDQTVRRFVREGLTMARLQHPAIVPILDAGMWEGGDPFLVMKLLEGKTVAEELSARATVEERIALLPNLLAVADALGFAHEQGVVHRDVKPSNIMLGKHGETVLLDWGVASDASAGKHETVGRGRSPDPIDVSPDASEQLTVAGSVTGTVRYMSPEQACGQPTAPGFDVYSLGVTIATVLSGRKPFDGTSHPQIMELLLRGQGSIPELPAETPADLRAIVVKATAPVSERYVHAGQLADDLRKYIAGQLVSARRYTRWELFARWLARNRVYVGVAGAALAIVAVVASVAVRSVIRERNVAVTQRKAADARARELVLLQARANLRVDPTATIAWLKQYPDDAPRQDEVLALVDEAASRGVARHVVRSTSQPVDLKVSVDSRSLVIAHRDGTLVRTDLATGAHRELAALGKAWALVRPTPDAVLALDLDGALYRIAGDGSLERRQTIRLPSRPEEMLFAGRTNELKVLFDDDEAMYVPLGSLDPPRVTKLPSQLVPYDFEDDGGSDTTALILKTTGDLFLLDTPPRKLWRFTVGTWIGTSPSGASYLAIVPGPKGRGMGEDVSIWVGTVSGAPPVQLGTMRACAPDADRVEEATVTDNGQVAVVRRCGALTLFSGGVSRELGTAERVSSFSVAPDGERLFIARGAVIELIERRTGATRELAGAETITSAGFSPDAAWLYSVGGDRGARVWPVAALVGHTSGKLADVVAPVRLVVTRTPGVLAIVRHLECGHWRTGERSIARSFGLPPTRARDLDDVRTLWPLDIAADGGVCVFAANDGVATVVGANQATRDLRGPGTLSNCVLWSDATRVTCIADSDALATFEVSRGANIAQRELDHGALRGLAPFHNRVVALVARASDCALETSDGKPVATLAGVDCVRVRASNAAQPGRETALLVARPTAVDVWTDAGTLTVPTEASLVEVSSTGLVAVAREQTVEIWDMRTRARRAGPPPHARAIERLAWSSTGTLAAADDETVRLWDPATGIVRVIYAPHALSIAWSDTGDTLFTSDGRTVDAWPVDIKRGASPREVRARLDQLTSARIVDGRVATP